MLFQDLSFQSLAKDVLLGPLHQDPFLCITNTHANEIFDSSHTLALRGERRHHLVNTSLQFSVSEVVVTLALYITGT